MKKRNSGFTLIELLVVIAIIAILAAILFPVFSKAREKARQASCLSNEKQILLGIMMYEEDYDELFPYCYPSDPISTNGPVFGPYNSATTIIDPYVKSTKIYTCPSAAPHSGAWADGVVNPDNLHITYQLNANLGGYEFTYVSAGSYTYGWTSPVSESSITHISNTIAMVETEDYGSEWWGCSGRSVWTGQQSAYQRHNGGNNLGFCDGHAKWVIGTNWEATAAGGQGSPNYRSWSDGEFTCPAWDATFAPSYAWVTASGNASTAAQNAYNAL